VSAVSEQLEAWLTRTVVCDVGEDTIVSTATVHDSAWVHYIDTYSSV